MPSEERLKAVFSESYNRLRPTDMVIDRLHLTVYPEQGVVIVIGALNNDETRQPHILEIGKVIAMLTEKGCQIEKVIPYPIVQGVSNKMGAIILYK